MKKLFLLLVVIASMLAGCAGTGSVGFHSELDKADDFASQKRYGEALTIYSRIAKESAGTDRGAKALFSAATARISFDNPHRDYTLALQDFEEFLHRYPRNEKAHEAQNWKSALRVMIELKKENEGLTQNIEQLKKIDIRHEERRRK